MDLSHAHTPPAEKKRWYRQLYFYVLVAIVLGVVVGSLWPDVGVTMEPIGAAFVGLMKMLIGPIVFLTIVGGIAGVADLKKVGLTGIRALSYFQIGTILAMVTGLVAINVFRLGDGVNADVGALKPTEDVGSLVEAGSEQHWWDFLLRVLPESAVAPFVEGNILQIIFMAVVFGSPWPTAATEAWPPRCTPDPLPAPSPCVVPTGVGTPPSSRSTARPPSSRSPAAAD